MKEILVAHGVQPRLGPETMADAEQEVNELREHFETAHRSPITDITHLLKRS